MEKYLFLLKNLIQYFTQDRFFYKRKKLKLHIFRLSGRDFVHYRKIEIGTNDRAVYQQSISCFIVYTNFDWFLINL